MATDPFQSSLDLEEAAQPGGPNPVQICEAPHPSLRLMETWTPPGMGISLLVGAVVLLGD